MQSTKVKNIILFFAFISLVTFSCQKFEINKEPKVVTVEISNISGTTAKVTGEIIDIGDGILDYGHCWGTSINPTVVGFKTSLGIVDTLGQYESLLSTLEVDTTYYVRSYCINNSKVTYGHNKSFTTLSPTLPNIITGEISSNDSNGVKIIGKLLDLGIGQNYVSSYGHCWATKMNPTINDLKTNFGTYNDTLTFESKIPNLLYKSTYYIRAYAINKIGVTYGNEISISNAQTKPNVILQDLYYGTSWAGVNLNISNHGNLPVEAYVCWNTTGNPTLSDESIKLLDFEYVNNEVYSLIDGLWGYTKYYIRAYVKNTVGGNYSEEISFRTSQTTLPTSYISFLELDEDNTLKLLTYFTSGGATINYAGVCWSNDPNPDINSDVFEAKTRNTPKDIGEQMEFVIGSAGIYYIRAFARNEMGIRYGDIYRLNIPETRIGLSLAKAKSFSMGINNARSDAIPIHTIQTESILVSNFEVTNQQYCDFLNQVSASSDGYLNGVMYINMAQSSQISYSQSLFSTNYPNYPVAFIPWSGADAYCNWIGGRLPTEAEWESFGNDNFGSLVTYAGSSLLDHVGWYNGNSSGHTNTVGQKVQILPSLYDISGNVREWCFDWYASDYYSVSPQENPQGPITGIYKVLRGGSYLTGEEKCRIYTRDYASPDTCAVDIGFRVVMH